MPVRHNLIKSLVNFLVGGGAVAATVLVVNQPAATPMLPPQPGFGIEKAYDLPTLPEPRNLFRHDTTDPSVRYNSLSGDP